jgi:hypothetical protein
VEHVAEALWPCQAFFVAAKKIASPAGMIDVIHAHILMTRVLATHFSVCGGFSLHFFRVTLNDVGRCRR